MVKKSLAILVAIVAALIIYVAVQPSEYFIKRDIVINAKPDVIYPYLVSMKSADKWMPWKESDPLVINTYTGPESGEGATSSWDSTGQMGTGKAEVTEAVLNQSVKTKITYTKPMEMEQDSEFILTPTASGTQMTWTVSGKSAFIPRLICTLSFMNMDKYVGGMFEKGLTKLKDMVEAHGVSRRE